MSDEATVRAICEAHRALTLRALDLLKAHPRVLDRWFSEHDMDGDEMGLTIKGDEASFHYSAWGDGGTAWRTADFPARALWDDAFVAAKEAEYEAAEAAKAAQRAAAEEETERRQYEALKAKFDGKESPIRRALREAMQTPPPD
jgi:hypothetical protein